MSGSGTASKATIEMQLESVSERNECRQVVTIDRCTKGVEIAGLERCRCFEDGERERVRVKMSAYKETRDFGADSMFGVKESTLP